MKKLSQLYYWMVGYRSRVTYWSDTKFSKRLCKLFSIEIPPIAATAHEWCEYKRRNEGTIRYWIVDRGLDIVQNVVLFVPDVYSNISRYIRNRFIDKPHYLDTKLPRGEWHEFDTRVLHGLFESLVDFVEIEKAHMSYISDELKDKKPKRVYPSRERGIEYLDWEISLGDENSGQSEAAQEIKELYIWWKDERPARRDPYDISGWSDYCEKREKETDGSLFCMLDDTNETEEDREEVSRILEVSYKVEQEQEDEDTEMLIRLIKCRRRMWT
jgi:hypothetical protein